MNSEFSCRPDVEARMTPEQGERYQSLLKRWWAYCTGDGFGGRYFRSYEKEDDLWGLLHCFCCEVEGIDPYPDGEPLPPELWRK